MNESTIRVKQIDITELDVDIIVNAATEALQNEVEYAERYFKKQGQASLQKHAQKSEDVKREMP